VMRSAPSYGSHGAVSRRTLVAVGLLSMVTGVALAIQLSGRSAEPAMLRASAAPVPAEQGNGPTKVIDGIPSGFSRTPEGAIAAAAAYVTTGQPLLDLDPLAAERAVRRMAASAYADRFAADTMRQLKDAREALSGGSGPIVYRQAVVAHRLEAFDAGRARVAIWNVGVLTRAGVAAPQAAWATSTFDLVWERGDWRIWAETIVPGPAPILNDSTAPATNAQFTAALEGFVDFARSS
jgi:hypothetical protein